MSHGSRARLVTLTRALLAIGILISVIGLSAFFAAGIAEEVDGMRAAGGFLICGLTIGALGLVVYALLAHGVVFLQAIIEAGTIRRRVPPPVEPEPPFDRDDE